jgi:hypothetical protein
MQKLLQLGVAVLAAIYAFEVLAGVLQLVTLGLAAVIAGGTLYLWWRQS